MVTSSSMHKPGWRSKRRSRLSLVERAVPRLGRLAEPEDGPKPSLSAPALKPPLKDVPQPSNGHEHEEPLHRETGAEVTHGKLPDDVQEKPTPLETPLIQDPDVPAVDAENDTAEQADMAGDLLLLDEDRNEIDDVVAERLLDVEVKPAASELPGTKEAEEENLPELPNSGVLPDSDFLEVGTPSSEPLIEAPASVASSETAPAQDEAGQLSIPAEFDPAIIEASLASLGARPMSLTGAGPGAGTTSIENHGRPLELEWDRLIKSGFADPRDRSRPLSQQMDPIIRVLLRQALSDQASWRDRVILVTSPTERVSKTTAAINFAFGLSTVGNHKAVLVDVDTMGSGAVDRLGGGDRVGITEALTDENREIDDLVIETGLDHLTLVASGAPDEDMIDHFGSQRMLQILRYLTEVPEAILVIDAPPILVSQEAAVLNVIAGQVVLAVEAGRTTADQIEHALQRLGDRHNVSLVLNASSGVVRHRDDVPKDVAQHADAMPPKAEEAKRRLLKAAAIFVVALGLFVAFSSDGHANADQALTANLDIAAEPYTSVHDLGMPERWSKQALLPAVSCHRACG